MAKKSPLYSGAQLFSQRCSGCHTFSYAAANGSAPNVRTAQSNSGPNFNVRCERPIARVLYAIENGGFSGAYMPQNVVVGQDAINVAKFVSTYAGRKAPKVVGIPDCQSKPIGTIPARTGTPTATTAASATAASPPAASPPAASTPTATTAASAATTSTATTAASAPASGAAHKQKKSARS